MMSVENIINCFNFEYENGKKICTKEQKVLSDSQDDWGLGRLGRKIELDSVGLPVCLV
jgi:hypothetical protein